MQDYYGGWCEHSEHVLNEGLIWDQQDLYRLLQ